MSRIVSSEISKVASRTKQLGGSLYRIPWYIAFGEPRAGKSSALRAMNLTWDKPQTMDGFQVVVVAIPASLLDPGDYKVLLSGATGQKPPEIVGRYGFHISRR